MIDILSKLKNFIERLVKFVAVSNNPPLHFRFGKLHAVIGRRKSIFLNKRSIFDSETFGWIRKKAASLNITPSLEANPHIVISGMSGFGKSTLSNPCLLE